MDLEKTMEQVLPHDAYYTHLKKEAAESMAHICGFATKPESRSDVRDCVIKALEDGTSFEAAEMLMLAAEWLHACHELREHK